MVTEYRKKFGGRDTWHFCSNCPNYPMTNFVAQSAQPTFGELCDECLGRQSHGNCSDAVGVPDLAPGRQRQVAY